MEERKDLKKLEIELFGTFKRKTKVKRFIPKYKITTYKGISKKWYMTSDNSIKIVNGNEYDWELIKDDYKNEEEFIISLIEKQLNQ